MEERDIEVIYSSKIRRWTLTLGGLVAALLISIVVALSIGYTSIPFTEVAAIIFGQGEGVHETIVLRVRLPRIALACLVGAGLTVAGVAMQGLFRNPMASPYVLGLSSGAAFGASLAMVMGISVLSGELAVPAMAFLFCFITLFMVYNISKVGGRVPVETLLLAGIAVGAFFSAMVSLMKYLAGEKLANIVFWMMGGLYNAGWDKVWIVMPFILVGSVIILAFSRDLNAMMIGEDHAQSMGVDVRHVRVIILIGASITTAASVAFAGIIGFVGLIVPHILRILVGPDHRILVPSSILVGAIFMIATDTAARMVMSPEELPVGIITAALGAPFFLYLLRKRRHETGW